MELQWPTYLIMHPFELYTSALMLLFKYVSRSLFAAMISFVFNISVLDRVYGITIFSTLLFTGVLGEI